MYKKALCTSKVVVLLNKPIAFVTSSFPSPSSLLKLPYDFNEFSLKSFLKNKCTSTLKRVFFFNAITLRKFVKSSSGVVVAVTVVEFLWHLFSSKLGGERDGAVVRAFASHQCGSASNPGVDAIMWVEFVVASLFCSERFFSGYSGFPFLLKNQHFQIPIQPGFR